MSDKRPRERDQPTPTLVVSNDRPHGAMPEPRQTEAKRTTDQWRADCEREFAKFSRHWEFVRGRNGNPNFWMLFMPSDCRPLSIFTEDGIGYADPRDPVWLWYQVRTGSCEITHRGRGMTLRAALKQAHAIRW